MNLKMGEKNETFFNLFNILALNFDLQSRMTTQHTNHAIETLSVRCFANESSAYNPRLSYNYKLQFLMFSLEQSFSFHSSLVQFKHSALRDWRLQEKQPQFFHGQLLCSGNKLLI